MKEMKIQAAPHHRILAVLLGIVAVGCYSYALFLYRQPLAVLVALIPLLVVIALVYVPYHRDHQGVTYEIAEQEIILWHKNQVYRRIPFEDIVSIRNRKGSILLRRQGFWHSGECLHPLSDSNEFAKAIEDKLQNKAMHVIAAERGKT